MLRSVKDLQGYAIQATDGEIGKVNDFYFDDQRWTVRYLVADTGKWLPGRLVLISPMALGQADWEGQRLHVSLTKQQVEDSPSIYEDEPVSRQYETAYYDYYGYPYYWGGPYLWGPAVYPAAPVGTPVPTEAPAQEERGDPHLRSMKEVSGYHIQARDGEIGHVEDFIVDDENWEIRHLIVDTRDWLPGRKVVISPRSIDKVTWEEESVYVGMWRGEIERAPEYDPSTLINQDQYIQLYG